MRACKAHKKMKVHKTRKKGWQIRRKDTAACKPHEHLRHLGYEGMRGT